MWSLDITGEKWTVIIIIVYYYEWCSQNRDDADDEDDHRNSAQTKLPEIVLSHQDDVPNSFYKCYKAECTVYCL